MHPTHEQSLVAVGNQMLHVCRRTISRVRASRPEGLHPACCTLGGVDAVWLPGMLVMSPCACRTPPGFHLHRCRLWLAPGAGGNGLQRPLIPCSTSAGRGSWTNCCWWLCLGALCCSASATQPSRIGSQHTAEGRELDIWRATASLTVP